MHQQDSPGNRFRAALTKERPLQIVGTINAYTALMAERTGFKSLYVSGAGVANASFGLPDLGITTLSEVVSDVQRITSATALPVLVDIDTGFGSTFSITRTIQQMTHAGAAAVHIEDQVAEKRCGHRPNKMITSQAEMVDRIKAAVDARTDPDFVIMARTDALATEGLSGAIERACAYVEAGADMIFAEAVTALDQYKAISEAVKVPILANITEFGRTPLFTKDQLASCGVQMALYPLSAFRAMNAAALAVYQAIQSTGSQQSMISMMQTRDALYDFLHYHDYEQKLDQLLTNQTDTHF